MLLKNASVLKGYAGVSDINLEKNTLQFKVGASSEATVSVIVSNRIALRNEYDGFVFDIKLSKPVPLKSDLFSSSIKLTFNDDLDMRSHVLAIKEGL